MSRFPFLLPFSFFAFVPLFSFPSKKKTANKRKEENGATVSASRDLVLIEAHAYLYIYTWMSAMGNFGEVILTLTLSPETGQGEICITAGGDGVCRCAGPVPKPKKKTHDRR